MPSFALPYIHRSLSSYGITACWISARVRGGRQNAPRTARWRWQYGEWTVV